MSKIKFGPGGLGGAKEAEKNLEKMAKAGLTACEISFVHSVYLKKEDAKRIGERAKKLGIELSIHASYYINLNAKGKDKIEATKKRVLDCCESANYLQCKKVIIHPGYYLGDTSEEAIQNVIKIINELQAIIKKKKWDMELCLETMGKNNVFGSIQEIASVVKSTNCSFCIDFAHILARYKNYNLEEISESFPQKTWHCHFSGIEYGENGERKHLKTNQRDWKKILDFIKKNDKNATIICESPEPFIDSVQGMNLL